jgi:branched-chain amino acid transport system substrate-binding protein
MRRILRPAATACALLAVGIGMAACGDDDEAAGGGSSGSSGDKAPIVIGSIGTQTGTFASSNKGGQQGVEAWVKAINAKGGVDGHPVELKAKDDQNNPSVALTAIKELAADKDVVAVVGNVSAVEDAWVPVASQAGLPIVGDFPYAPISYSTKGLFPQGTTFPSVMYGQVYTATKFAKAPKIAMFYCAEQPACEKSSGLIDDLAKSMGGDMVNAQGVPATAPNYDAQCSAAKKAGAESIIMALGTSTIISIAESCASIGYKPKYVFQSTALTPAQGKVEALADSAYGVVMTFPWVSDSTPAQKEFQEAAKSAGIGADDMGAAVSLGYTGAALFGEAAKSAGGDVTRESLTKALYGLPPKTDLDGLAPPLTYKADAPSPEQKCFFVMQLQGGEWTSPYEDQETCQP